jgi:hypothetical protein
MFDELTKAELEGSTQNKTRVAKGLSEYKAWASGIQFKQAENYKDKWATLPGYEELKEQNP